MPPEVEWQLWRQLRGAFRIDRFHMVPVVEDFVRGGVFQFDTMEQALEATEGSRVFLEPTGQNSVGDIPGSDIVLVCGNTECDNMSLAKPEETYRINTPKKTVLYGSDAAAIALAIRYGQ